MHRSKSLKAARQPSKAEPEEVFRIDALPEKVIREAFQPAEDIIEDPRSASVREPGYLASLLQGRALQGRGRANTQYLRLLRHRQRELKRFRQPVARLTERDNRARMVAVAGLFCHRPVCGLPYPHGRQRLLLKMGCAKHLAAQLDGCDALINVLSGSLLGPAPRDQARAPLRR